MMYATVVCTVGVFGYRVGGLHDAGGWVAGWLGYLFGGSLGGWLGG